MGKHEAESAHPDEFPERLRKPVRRVSQRAGVQAQQGGTPFGSRKPLRSWGIIADLYPDGTVGLRYIRREWQPWRVVDVLLTNLPQGEACEETVRGLLSTAMLLADGQFPRGLVRP